MAIVTSIIGIFFLTLAGLVLSSPYSMIKLLNRIDIRWSVDKELFLNSLFVRISVGLMFILAAIAMFFAGYSILK